MFLENAADLLQSVWLRLGLLGLVGPVLFFLVLERLFPAEPGHTLRAVWDNLKIGLVYIAVTTASATLIVTLTAWLMRPFPSGLLDLRFATQSNFWLDLTAMLLWFLIYDFFYYWFHRAQHMLPWLWAEHRMHHSTPALNAAAGRSHHWLEELLRVPLVAVPFGVLFKLNPYATGMVGVLAHGWSYFIHANIRLDMGWMTPVIAGPQLHRMHHSLDPAYFNRNFSAFFPVWDILFGTYHRPVKGQYVRTGVAGFALPRRLRDILIGPLAIWWCGMRSALMRARS
jgi:sterol desaturase/sphingolipid hydroxylase (fatty acid hydroxylase superfamily)